MGLSLFENIPNQLLHRIVQGDYIQQLVDVVHMPGVLVDSITEVVIPKRKHLVNKGAFCCLHIQRKGLQPILLNQISETVVLQIVVNQTGCQHPFAGVGFDVNGSLHDQMFLQVAGRKDGGILHHIPVVVPAAADFIRICEGKAKFIKDGNNGLLQLLPLPLRGMCF